MRRFIVLSLLAASALSQVPASAQTSGQQAQTAQQPRPAAPPAGTPPGPIMPGPGGMHPGMMGHGMGPGMTGGWGARGDGFHDMSDMLGSKRVEGRIAFLKTELKITEAQTQAWNSFADAMRNAAKIMDALEASRPQTPPANPAAVSVLDRMAQREAYLSARLKSLSTLREAMAKLYPALSEEQKTTANQLIGGHLGMLM